MCVDSCLVSFLLVSECSVISISFFEVSCQSYVSFSRCAGCDSRLVYNVACEALSFEGALVFLSAVPFFHGFCDRG